MLPAALQALAEKWADEAMRAHCSPSVPSRIRTIRCEANSFPRCASCTPGLAASFGREPWMAFGRILMR